MTEKKNRVPVSREFREWLLDVYPRAFEETSEARLLQELLFPRWRDDLTGAPVLSQWRLATLEGRERDLKHHRYSGLAFLRAFEQHLGATLRITEADWLEGRSRTVRLCLPIALEQVLAIELRLPPPVKPVDFLTGRPMLEKEVEKLRAARRTRRRTYRPPPELRAPSAPWALFLNKTPPHVFRRFERNIEQAVAVAESFDDPERRQANLLTLHVLRYFGLDPAYQVVERTPRIYTSGWSTAQLSANVRAVLLSGALHFDLRSAQLAIVAVLWGLPTIQGVLEDALRQGVPAWPRLLKLVGLPDNDDKVKDSFKTLVYATAYGMGQENLRQLAAERFGEKAKALFASALMRELLRGRQARLRRLQAEGGIVDAFEEAHSLEERRSQMSKPDRAALSLLAHEAQSFELRLMQPALELARRTSEFRVVLWLHDGLYAAVTQPEREGRYVERVVREVNERAERLGFATRLDFKKLS